MQLGSKMFENVVFLAGAPYFDISSTELRKNLHIWKKSVTFADEFQRELQIDKQNNIIINYKWISYYDSHNIQQTERSEG